MSSLVNKNTLRVENYENKGGGGDHFLFFKRVRCSSESGETVYFKELVVPSFLAGAIKSNKVSTLYTVDLGSGKAHCLVAYESAGQAKFDPDELSDVAKGFRNSGLFFFFGGTLASVLALIAYGLGLILFPIAMYMAWRYFIKIPALLKRDDVVNGLKKAGFQFPIAAPFPTSSTSANAYL